MLKIVYAYPEPLPSQRARCVQAMGTATALAELVPLTLVAEISGNPFTPFGLHKPDGMRVVDLRRRFGPFIWNRWFYSKCETLLRRQVPDVVYVRHPKLARDLAVKGYPVVYEVHEILSDKHHGQPEPLEMENAITKRARGIVAISNELRNRWHQVYGSIPSAVVPSGTFFDAHFDKELVSGPIDTIYYLGTSQYEWKGVTTLLEALERIQGIRLTFIGDFSSNQVPKTTRSRVDCLGHVPNKKARDLLKRAQITVLPNSGKHVTSRLYTSPLKLLEYMAARTAIVASDLPSVREIVSENEVLFFEPDDPITLARAIDRLARDGELRHRLAWSAWRKAESYSWEVRANRIEAFLKSLL